MTDWFTVWLETGVTLVMVALVILLVWWCTRARPIGDRPYAWGTYLATITALLSVYFCLQLIIAISAASTIGIVGAAALLLGALLTTIGIFQRKKRGAVAFVFTYSLLVVANVTTAVYGNQAAWPAVLREIPMLIVIICSVIYFKRRWHLLGRTPGSAAEGCTIE